MADPALKGDVTISIRVSDWRASAAWYERALGYTLLYSVEDLGWCELATPSRDVTIGLGQYGTPGSNASCVPVLGVRDIDAQRRRMEAMGVRFEGETRTIEGLVKLATFSDPDGNTLMLSQSLAKEVR